MTQRLLRLVPTLLALAALALAAAQERPATLADAVRATPELATLAELLGQSGLMAELEGPQRLTLFAPTDAALEALDHDALATLRRDTGALDVVIRHHLVFGASPTAALRRLDAVTTLEGTQLGVSVTGETIRLAGVRLLGDGVVTGTGVLYLVDRVLLPDAALLRKDILGGPGRPDTP